jgi:hypothetical protein
MFLYCGRIHPDAKLQEYSLFDVIPMRNCDGSLKHPALQIDGCLRPVVVFISGCELSQDAIRVQQMVDVGRWMLLNAEPAVFFPCERPEGRVHCHIDRCRGYSLNLYAYKPHIRRTIWWSFAARPCFWRDIRKFGDDLLSALDGPEVLCEEYFVHFDLTLGCYD